MALLIISQWKGALTGSLIFLIDFSFKILVKCSKSSVFPLKTIWPSELSFAIWALNIFLFSAKIFSITSIFEPNTATIPPCPLGTEFCIASPLILKIFKVSEKSKYPAHDKAEYSPKECPAKYLALFKSKLNSFLTILNIE